MAEPPRPRLGRPAKVGGDGEPEVFCVDEQDEVPVDLARWQRPALDVLADEGVRGLAELSVLYLDEADMAELNEDYMQHVGPTDVLAFPLDAHDVTQLVASTGSTRGPDRAPVDPGDLPLLLGDVVICPAVAQRQAPEHEAVRAQAVPLEEAEAMRARERELLERHHWRGPAPEGFRQEQE